MQVKLPGSCSSCCLHACQRGHAAYFKLSQNPNRWVKDHCIITKEKFSCRGCKPVIWSWIGSRTNTNLFIRKLVIHKWQSNKTTEFQSLKQKHKPATWSVAKNNSTLVVKNPPKSTNSTNTAVRSSLMSQGEASQDSERVQLHTSGQLSVKAALPPSPLSSWMSYK